MSKISRFLILFIYIDDVIKIFNYFIVRACYG